MSYPHHRIYEDFLLPRRKEFSNLIWVNKEIKAQLAYEQVHRSSPHDHKEAVKQSMMIRLLIEKLSKESKIPTEVLQKQLENILNEIGYHKNLHIIRSVGLVLTKILLRILNGIYVNYHALRELKSLMGHCPVVFVPSHRSYADFIIFSYVCFNYDIELPAVAAGMDFQGMMGMGEMLRNIGAFFLRRAKDDDVLYWAAFKQYVYQIVTKGDKPIEFFIEGTRSRSNKTMAPKYGLINMILKAFFIGTVPDIIFVPVSICYDRILEESLFAFELLGMPKPKESTSGFFKSLKILKEKFGNIYFHIDHPISAREFFGSRAPRVSHSLGPVDIQETTDEEKKIIPSLAYEILRRQQICGVITTFNLIATILNDSIARNHKSISFDNLVSEVENLRVFLKYLGAHVFEEDVRRAIELNLIIHENLIHRLPNGQIELVTNKIVLGNVDASKLKAHAFSANTISYAVPFFMLQIYSNPIFFHVSDMAILVTCLEGGSELTKDELSSHFHFFKTMFALEFVSPSERVVEDFEKALQHTTKLNLIESSDGLFRSNQSNNNIKSILLSSIQPFILTYYAVLEVLEKVPDSTSEKSILVAVQELLEGAINRRKIFIHPYCLSLDTLTNCLNNLSTNMKYLRKSRRDNTTIYDVNRADVQVIKNKLVPKIYHMPGFRHIVLENLPDKDLIG